MIKKAINWAACEYAEMRSWRAAYLVLKCRKFIRHIPVMKCPCCNGKGGWTSGYYEPEWSECYICYRDGNDYGDGEGWFEGRVSPLAWIRWKVANRLGTLDMFGYFPSVTRSILCWMGFHRWHKCDYVMDVICKHCDERKPDEIRTNEDEFEKPNWL